MSVKKHVVTGALMLFATALWGGNVCHWTGGGTNALWSTAANWDTPPVSGNGDTVVFDLPRRLTLLSAPTVEGTFAASDITVTGLGRSYGVIRRGNAFALVNRTGTVVVFR